MVSWQVLCLIAFISSVIGSTGWSSFASISGLILVAVSFTIHIINYFPDTTMALLIVRLMLMVV